MSAPLPRITDGERAVATLARRAMAIYRAYAGLGAYHLASSDVRLYAWPEPHQVAGVAELGARASHIEVVLSASDEDETGARGIADELEIALYTAAGRELVVSAHRSPQGSITLLVPPPDTALMPALRWAALQAAEGSY